MTTYPVPTSIHDFPGLAEARELYANQLVWVNNCPAQITHFRHDDGLVTIHYRPVGTLSNHVLTVVLKPTTLVCTHPSTR